MKRIWSGMRSVIIFAAACWLSWEILNRCIELPGQISNVFLLAQYLFPFGNYWIAGPERLFSTLPGWIATGAIFLGAIIASFFVGVRFRSVIASVGINFALMVACSFLLHGFAWLNSAKFELIGP